MMQPHHIGYLVKDINRAKKEFIELGYVIESDVIYDQYRNINICFLKNEYYRIELVMPVNEKSIVYNLIKKQGAGTYHICYKSDDFDKDFRLFRDRGYISLGEVMPAPAIDNVKAAFFFHIQFGIVELIEAL